MLNKSDENRHPCLVSDLRGKSFSISDVSWCDQRVGGLWRTASPVVTVLWTQDPKPPPWLPELSDQWTSPVWTMHTPWFQGGAGEVRARAHMLIFWVETSHTCRRYQERGRAQKVFASTSVPSRAPTVPCPSTSWFRFANKSSHVIRHFLNCCLCTGSQSEWISKRALLREV